MLKPPGPYRLRSMRLSDIETVMSIELNAFPVPWHESAYKYEVAENRLANYQVLTVQLADLPAKVVGYAGYWMLVDEAHISTLAVNSQWLGRGLGELLLINLIRLAYKASARIASLEVRTSNTIAQALYKKYRFEVVGNRRRYYQGKEDALIMTVEPLDSAYSAFLKTAERTLFQRLARDLMMVGRSI